MKIRAYINNHAVFYQRKKNIFHFLHRRSFPIIII